MLISIYLKMCYIYKLYLHIRLYYTLLVFIMYIHNSEFTIHNHQGDTIR